MLIGFFFFFSVVKIQIVIELKILLYKKPHCFELKSLSDISYHTCMTLKEVQLGMVVENLVQALGTLPSISKKSKILLKDVYSILFAFFNIHSMKFIARAFASL